MGQDGPRRAVLVRFKIKFEPELFRELLQFRFKVLLGRKFSNFRPEPKVHYFLRVAP